jgi:ElaB/YqjD/DUF883 family membrane-anchored ribosome-binding protein
MTARKTNNHRDRLREDAHQIGDDLRRLGGHAKEMTAERVSVIKDSVQTWVQAKPLQSFLIVAGAGFLLGWFSRRR